MIKKAFMFAIAAATALSVAAADDADEKVISLVKETRSLMAEGKKDEALGKVKEALAVEGAGKYALANVYNVYSDWARAEGREETADKSLLKAYDFLLKARDEAKGAERRRIGSVASSVAERLSKSPSSQKLLEDYRNAKREKAQEEFKEKMELRAKKRREEIAARKESRAKKNAPVKGINPFNPWKKPVVARKFPGGKRPFPDKFPYTREDMLKVTEVIKKNRATGGAMMFRQTYEILRRYGVQNALNWWEYILEKPTKINLSDGEKASLWNWYCFHANLANDFSRVLQGFAELKQRGLEPSGHTAYRVSPNVKMYEDLVSFPKSEEEIVFPDRNIWVEEKKTVHAKDFGWNEDNATECLQKALDSGATTIIVDKMPAHWRIRSVRVGSNKSIIFEDGVKVLADKVTAENNSPVCMFNLSNSKNVFMEGKGKVYIGKYETPEERNRYVKDYGGDAFVLAQAQNVVIRNFTIAENSDDAIVIGGIRGINNNIYIEDCDLVHNCRQAMSITCGNHIYMRRVKFRKTTGLQPMCGIDFEPSIQEVQGTASIYLFDCEFENNDGGDINFSESSPYPVTMYAKRCTFAANRWGPAITIFPLYGLYMGNGTDAPSDIIFDECKINCYMWKPAVVLSNANLFHVTLRNCEIIQDQARGTTSSPIVFNLGREYAFGLSDNVESYAGKQGSLWFDKTVIKGFKGAQPLGVIDQTGRYPLKNIGGTLIMNGRTYDMSKFEYEAPDLKMKLKNIVPLMASSLKPPVRPRAGGINVNYNWSSPWYEAHPEYKIFTYSESEGKWQDGMRVKHSEERPVTFTRLGVPSLIQSVTGNPKYKFAGGGIYYFQVPGGKGEVVVKVTEGTVALVLGRDNEIERADPRSYGAKGYHYFVIKQQSQPKTFGLKILSRSATFKMHQPLDGLIATDPSHLPEIE